MSYLSRCSYIQGTYPMTNQQRLTAINPEALAEAQAAAPPEALPTLVVEAFEGLADPIRARLLSALVRCPLCMRDLAILVGV